MVEGGDHFAKWSIAEWANGREGVGWGCCTLDFEDEDEDDFEGEAAPFGFRLFVMRVGLQAAVGDGFGGGRGA